MSEFDKFLYTPFGQREICNVTLKAYTNKKIGNRIFKKGEPIFIFDTLKTADLDVISDIVEAKGGRGNQTKVYWDNEKIVTLKITDALLSPITYNILNNGQLNDNDIINYHINQKVKGVKKGKVWTLDYSSNKFIDPIFIYPYDSSILLNEKFIIKKHGYFNIVNRATTNYWNGQDVIYLYPNRFWRPKDVISIIYDDNNLNSVMLNENDYILNEDYIDFSNMCIFNSYSNITNSDRPVRRFVIQVPNIGNNMNIANYSYMWLYDANLSSNGRQYISFIEPWNDTIFNSNYFLLDGYEERDGKQIIISSDDINGDYIIEAECLWRNEKTNEDKMIYLIIPHVKLNINNNFIMSGNGDPQVYDFNLDVIPKSITQNKKDKILYTLQINNE